MPRVFRPAGEWQPSELADATRVVADGGLAIFPTETVYGVGVDARRASAVGRLRALKGLDPGRPLLLHCPDPAWLEKYAAAVPGYARRLAAAFWPGPLALVLAKSESVPPGVCGDGSTVGIRVVDHPVTRALLEALGSPVAGTSANFHGHPPPGRFEDVSVGLLRGTDVAIDAGACPVGTPSTVIDASTGHPRLLRAGAVSREAIETLLGFELA